MIKASIRSCRLVSGLERDGGARHAVAADRPTQPSELEVAINKSALDECCAMPLFPTRKVPARLTRSPTIAPSGAIRRQEWNLAARALGFRGRGCAYIEARWPPSPKTKVASLDDATENTISASHATPKNAFARSPVARAASRSDAAERGDLDTALAHLTEVAAETMRVERASVWRYSDDRSKLVCVDLYERFTDRHMSGTVIDASDKPRYFEALSEERSIAAHDAWQDERTNEFTESYLRPLGISSMMDAPIVFQGNLVGVVCIEHVARRASGSRGKSWWPARSPTSWPWCWGPRRTARRLRRSRKPAKTCNERRGPSRASHRARSSLPAGGLVC